MLQTGLVNCARYFTPPPDVYPSSGQGKTLHVMTKRITSVRDDREQELDTYFVRF
jgi:hypothetical protein